MLRQAQARDDQRKRVLRDSWRQFTLPDREPASVYRVRWRQAKLQTQANGAILLTVSGGCPLTPVEADIAQWIMERDYFDVAGLSAEFSSATSGDLSALIQKLLTAGLIESLD